MKIRLCPQIYEYGFIEVIVDVRLTKRDLEERTWAKHERVTLVKTKEDEISIPCFTWMSDRHNDKDLIVGYEYVEGYTYNNDVPKDEIKKIISVLENDKEWKETIENLKKFAISLLERLK